MLGQNNPYFTHRWYYLYFIPQAICLSPYAVLISDGPPPSALWRVSGKSWLLFESLGQSVYNSLAALPSEVEWQTKASWHGPCRRTQFLLCIKKSQNHTQALRMNRGKKEERRKQRQASDLLKALQLKPPSQRRSHFNKIEFKWWRQKLHEREGGREFLALVIVVQEKMAQYSLQSAKSY